MGWRWSLGATRTRFCTAEHAKLRDAISCEPAAVNLSNRQTREAPKMERQARGRAVHDESIEYLRCFHPAKRESQCPALFGRSSQPVQYPGGGAQQPQMPGGQGRQQSPNMPVGQQGQNPNMGPNEIAQMQRAAMIDNAAKQCAATPSTTSFGLALGDGQVIRFDGDGDSKASQAIKDVELEPGKAVKATINGIDRGSGSVQVASVEIKHKGKRAT